MIVLGIDPGNSRIGYGVIERRGSELMHIASGLLPITGSDQAGRLKMIEIELNNIIKKFKPNKIGLEKLFFFKNKKTVIAVAEARGVILSTVEKNGIPFSEFTPLQVKLAVTGDGTAKKEAVAKMVRYFLKLPTEKMIDDASDALAIAIATSAKTY